MNQHFASLYGEHKKEKEQETREDDDNGLVPIQRVVHSDAIFLFVKILIQALDLSFSILILCFQLLRCYRVQHKQTNLID